LREKCENTAKEGLYSPPPFFYASSTFRNNCETSDACKKLGGIGNTKWTKYRVPIMLAASFVSFVCMILQLVPVISITTSADTIRDVFWTKGSGTIRVANGTNLDVDLYIGIKATVISLEGLEQVKCSPPAAIL